MSNTISWINKLINLLKEFARAIFTKSEYEILDIYECNNTGLIKAQIKLFGRHIIERSIGDIVTDIHFLEGFDKKTVRTLTYMATIEAMKPNYSIVVQQLGNEIDDYVL